MFTNPVLTAIGAKYNKTAAQVALRFLLQSDVVVIPKSVHKDRMQQNFDLFDFTLSAEDMAAVEALDGGESLFFSHYDPKTVEWFMSFVLFALFWVSSNFSGLFSDSLPAVLSSSSPSYALSTQAFSRINSSFVRLHTTMSFLSMVIPSILRPRNIASFLNPSLSNTLLEAILLALYLASTRYKSRSLKYICKRNLRASAA